MLQLSDEPDQKLVEQLGKVKDIIGEWHDWVELLKIAKKVLDPAADGGILRQVEKIAKEKLQAALAVANQLRDTYFKSADARGGKKVLQMAAGF
jgi:CHAD domain-containing protein